MWFMPSYGRPQRLEDLLEAPGGWPDHVKVLLNIDDPELERYHQVLDRLKHQGRDAPWELVTIPRGSRCADAHRFASHVFPDEPFYGLLCDDHWPITEGWHGALVEAAGTSHIAGPNGEKNFPLLRNVVVFGGDLVRAMESLVPVPVKHNFEDNFWDKIAADFGILVSLREVRVHHRHWTYGTAAKDATYTRGSADFDEDQRIYQKWMLTEYPKVAAKVGEFLGMRSYEFDTKDVLLEIVVPIQDHLVDAIYHKSLMKTLMYLQQRGVATRVTEATGGSNIGKARERVLWSAYKREPKATHFAFIDADMGWEPEQLVRLIAADHEFSAIVGVRKSEELQLCANFYKENEWHSRTNFLRLKDVGFAFVVLKRTVIDQMVAAFPELLYKPFEEKEYALFLEMIDEGERLSEDFSFCRRWTQCGGKIWCDPNAALFHSGMKLYTGRVADLFSVGAQKEGAL